MRENVPASRITLNGENKNCPLSDQELNAKTVLKCLKCEHKQSLFVMNGRYYRIDVKCEKCDKKE